MRLRRSLVRYQKPCARHFEYWFCHLVPLEYRFRKPTCTSMVCIKTHSARSVRNMSFRLSKVFAGRVMTTLSLFTAFLLLVPSLLGQGITTGSITGTVEDQQQQVIPGAKVTAIENGTNVSFNATSDGAGSFELRGLPVGTYNVTIEASGFSKKQVTNVGTSAGRASSLGVQTLGVASAQETVTVEG